MAKPPSQPQELPPYAPAVFACVPHSSLATESRFCFFGLRREPAAPSHTRQRRPARLESQRNSFPRSSHAFSRSWKRQRVAPHYHQVTGTEILDNATAMLAPSVSRRLEKTSGKACQHRWAFAFIGGDIQADATRL